MYNIISRSTYSQKHLFIITQENSVFLNSKTYVCVPNASINRCTDGSPSTDFRSRSVSTMEGQIQFRRTPASMATYEQTIKFITCYRPYMHNSESSKAAYCRWRDKNAGKPSHLSYLWGGFDAITVNRRERLGLGLG